MIKSRIQPSTTSIRQAPSAQQLYQKLVKKIHKTDTISRLKLKSDLNNKYEKHLSLLESHKRRESRFQQSFCLRQKLEEQRNKKLKNVFQFKQEKTKSKKGQFLTEKRKKMADSLDIWRGVVHTNQQRYRHQIEQSSTNIEKWNEKCNNSISKKNQRLNTYSSNLSERSRISSAKTVQNRQRLQQKLQNLLLKKQKQLNPQSSVCNKNLSRKNSKSQIANVSSSRMSSLSKQTFDNNREKYESIQHQQSNKYLQKILNKQSKILQARNKKSDQQLKFLKQVQAKKEIKSYLHKKNNQYLLNKREQMQQKLDAQFFQDRKNKLKPSNMSLPSIKDHNLNKFESVNDLPYLKQAKIQIKSKNYTPKYNPQKVFQKNYDSLIIEELRNIALVMKLKKNNK